LPNALAEPFKIPMYQFSHLQAKARERYKDDSINIRGAGEKVRKLVNEHLISLGIDPKVPPVELFSDKFITQLNEQKDPRAAASEMEHAIRKHCKVNEADDPVMYKRFSEKLAIILKKYHDNWDQMLLEMNNLRDEVNQGRGDDAGTGDPFYDLIAEIAFDGKCPDDLKAQLAGVVDQVINVLAEKIEGLNFWQRPKMVAELEGKLQELFILSGISELDAHLEQITTDILDLARHREEDILSDYKSKSSDESNQ